MNRPDVSVIIPVYRVGPYIEKCVRSLFEQSHHSIEYIFVDDCGGDDSMDIVARVLSEYPERNSSVHIIRNEQNMGVAVSRMRGLEAATGRYIIHCDPDDWVHPDIYRLLLEKAEETGADLVLCDFDSVIGDTAVPFPQRPLEMTADSMVRSVAGLSPRRIHGALWNKLVRADFARRAPFLTGINFCEDVLVLFRILLQQPKIAYLPRTLYYYRVGRPDALTREISLAALEQDRRLAAAAADILSSCPDCACAFSAVVLHRAFRSRCYSDREFAAIYRPFSRSLSLNRQLPALRRLCLRISLLGAHSLALGAWNLSARIKHFIKRAH